MKSFTYRTGFVVASFIRVFFNSAEGVESSSNVAVYSGAAVGGFVFLIIILVVIIITIGCLVYWKRE